MSESRSEKMVKSLRAMQTSAPDIEASAVVSVDGLIMASALPAEVEEDRVSAMSAAMLSLGERIAGELGRGGLDQVYIKGDSGFIMLTAIGDEAVLFIDSLSKVLAAWGTPLVGRMRRETTSSEQRYSRSSSGLRASIVMCWTATPASQLG